MLARYTVLFLSLFSISCQETAESKKDKEVESALESLRELKNKDKEKVSELTEARFLEIKNLLTKIGIKSEYIESLNSQINNKAQFTDWDVISVGKIYAVETLTRESIKIVKINFNAFNSEESGLKILAITVPTNKIFISSDIWEPIAIAEATSVLNASDKTASIIGDYLVIESSLGSIKLKN